MYWGYQKEIEGVNCKTSGIKNGINYKNLEPRPVIWFLKLCHYVYTGFVLQRRKLSKLILRN